MPVSKKKIQLLRRVRKGESPAASSRDYDLLYELEKDGFIKKEARISLPVENPVRGYVLTKQGEDALGDGNA